MPEVPHEFAGSASDVPVFAPIGSAAKRATSLPASTYAAERARIQRARVALGMP